MNLLRYTGNSMIRPLATPYASAMSEPEISNFSMFNEGGFDEGGFHKGGRRSRPNSRIVPNTQSNQENLSGGQGRRGNHELPEVVRSMDWSRTAIGPIESWPSSLMNAVELSLNANHPIAIFWGQDGVLLYNDAWRSLAGDRDMRFLGQKVGDAWPEVWQILGPQIQTVRLTARGASYKDQLLPVHRFGHSQECYFSYSLNPIKASDGTVEGVFSIVEETTASVINARREELVRELQFQTAEAKSPAEACALAAAAIATDPSDLPFALVYLVDWERQRAVLAGSAGMRSDSAAAPRVVDLADARDLLKGWPIAEVAESSVAQKIVNLSAKFGFDFDSPWREPLREALVLPISATAPAKTAGERLAGVLVAGVTPRRALDDDYLDFCYSVCAQTAKAIDAARGNQEEQQRSARLEEQLRNSQKMEEAGQLAAGAAHDLNNLLTMIYGHSDLLSEQVTNDPMREDVALISSACERAMSLTKHLLAFSRRQSPEVRLLNLNKVITDFEPLLRGLVGRNIELITALSPRLDQVMADPRQLERVIMNLVINARDAMPHGGKLTIETSHAASDGVQEGSTAGPSVLLTITDTGTGMDQATLSRLFDPFFTTKAPGKGTGLGLATVREILKQNGGAIWVESEPGQGTSFKLALPRMAKGND